MLHLMPKDTPEHLAPAWVGCMHWAIGNADIVAAFRAETGNNWQPGRTALDRKIDESTGVEKVFVEAFIKWANVNVWGTIEPNDGGEDE